MKLKGKTMLLVFSVALTLFTSIMTMSNHRQVNEQEIVTADAEEAVVSLVSSDGRGRGTGFLTTAASGKQVIVTNAHVCEINNQIPIFVLYHRTPDSLSERSNHPVTVIKKYSKHDLCMLTVPSDYEATPLTLADSAEVDRKFYLLGYPVVNLLSVSTGYVRGYNTLRGPYPLPLELCVGEKHYIYTGPISNRQTGAVSIQSVCAIQATFLFTDALADHGASGGPALNSDGQVIGVVSMIVGEARPFAHLVPVEDLRDFLSTY